MSEKQFVNGLIVKRNENAPDWVYANLSINREELIAWLEAQEGKWVNVVLKRAKSGKGYAEVDNWKPPRAVDLVTAPLDDAIPF